jgi:hypothetical protein
MPGSRNVLERRLIVACSALLLGVFACGGKEFTPGGTTMTGGVGGADAGGASGGATGGASNSGASASEGGGDAGASAGAASSCSCKAGQYCREGSTDCFDCAELSRLRFAKPERLSTLSDVGLDARSPRSGSTSTDLLYSFQGVGIRYTPDASTSAGAAINMTTPEDGAPLLLLGDTTLPLNEVMSGANFVFDRVVDGTRRQLYVGRWNRGLDEAKPISAPFNGPLNDYSVAVAAAPVGDGKPRLFWMTDRDPALGLTLVTALAEDAGTGSPVLLQLGKVACSPALMTPRDDLTPWVTSDGKTLLVSHTGMDAGCAPADTGKDVYTAPLQPATGQPTLPAALLSDVNSDADDVDPSFSADMCDLYFASNRDGGAFALYRARRH